MGNPSITIYIQLPGPEGNAVLAWFSHGPCIVHLQELLPQKNDARLSPRRCLEKIWTKGWSLRYFWGVASFRQFCLQSYSMVLSAVIPLLQPQQIITYIYIYIYSFIHLFIYIYIYDHMYTIRSKREKTRSFNGFWRSKIWSHPDGTTSTVHLAQRRILAPDRTLVYKPAWNTWALASGQVTVGTPKISKDGSFHDVSIFIEPWYCISMIPPWYPMFLPYFTGVSWFALHFYWLNHDSAPTTAFRPNWGHSLPGSSAGWVGTPGWIYVENPTYGGYMDTKPMLFISTLELGEKKKTGLH